MVCIIFVMFDHALLTKNILLFRVALVIKTNKIYMKFVYMAGWIRLHSIALTNLYMIYGKL